MTQQESKVIPYQTFYERKLLQLAALNQTRDDLKLYWSQLSFDSPTRNDSVKPIQDLLRAEYVGFNNCGYFISLESHGIRPSRQNINIAFTNLEKTQNWHSVNAPVSASKFLLFMREEFYTNSRKLQPTNPSRADISLGFAQICNKAMDSIEQYMVQNY